MRTQKATTLIKSCFYVNSGGDGKKIGLESKRNKKSSRDNLKEKSDFERNTETPTNEGRTFVTEQSSSSKKEEKQLACGGRRNFISSPLSVQVVVSFPHKSFFLKARARPCW